MDRNDYEEKLNRAGSDLWFSCREARKGLDKCIITSDISEITDNLRQYIDLLKEEVRGRLEMIEALSAAVGLTDESLSRVRDFKASVSTLGVKCGSADEYIIDACALTMINENLMEAL